MRQSTVLGVLLFLVALITVYATSFSVGVATTATRRQEQITSTAHIVELKKKLLATCAAALAGHRKVQARREEAQHAARLELQVAEQLVAEERQRIDTVALGLRECKRAKEETQQELFGYVGDDAAAHAEMLERRHASLSADLHAAEELARRSGDAAVLNRSHAFALQTALSRELMGNVRFAPSAYLASPLPGTYRYSVVFDIGSTGNRVHVHQYMVEDDGRGGTRLRLVTSLFKNNRQPLSGYADEPEKCMEALLPLLEQAEAFVPAAEHALTPIVVSATAGLRKLGDDRAAAILRVVRRRLQGRGTFWLRGRSPVAIMKGDVEGYLAWVTVNYLLGAARNQSLAAVTIDLGGGSTQIAIPLPAAEQQRAEDHTPHHDGGDEDVGGAFPIRSYQHSYEGLGMREALTEVLYHVQGKCQPRPQGALAPFETEDQLTRDEQATSNFPCFPAGFQHQLGVGRSAGGTAGGGPDDGAADFDGCVDVFRRHILHDARPCGQAACGARGVPQPPLADFPGPIYAFSYIFDYMRDFVPANETEEGSVTLAEMEHGARERCRAVKPSLLLEKTTYEERREAATACMPYAYVYALLRYGYKIPYDRHIIVRQQLHGFELSWALGASVRMLSSMYHL